MREVRSRCFREVYRECVNRSESESKSYVRERMSFCV